MIGAGEMHPSAEDDGVAADPLEGLFDGVRIIFQSFAGDDFDQELLVSEGSVSAHDEVVIGYETLQCCSIPFDLRAVVFFCGGGKSRVEIMILREAGDCCEQNEEDEWLRHDVFVGSLHIICLRRASWKPELTLL